MKKTISILLTIILTLSLAACAAKSPAASGDIGVDSAKALLDTVWNSYSEDEKFPAAGGDFSEENMTDGAPGAYSVADASELDRVLGLPEADVAPAYDERQHVHLRRVPPEKRRGRRRHRRSDPREYPKPPVALRLPG